jgi:hypothetical protein
MIDYDDAVAAIRQLLQSDNSSRSPACRYREKIHLMLLLSQAQPERRQQHEHSGASQIALETFLGDPVNVLWFVPISEEERQVAINQGSERNRASQATAGNRRSGTPPTCRRLPATEAMRG